jgi:uncharacterized protein YkwD
MKEALMRKCLLCAVLASTALVLMQCGGGGGSKTTITPAIQMLSKINGNRNPDYKLTMDPAISAVAQAYAKYLGDTHAVTYTSNADGKSPQQRLNDAGITNFSAVGETGSGAANATVAYASMNSGTLNNTSYTLVGIGAYLCDT